MIKIGDIITIKNSGNKGKVLEIRGSDYLIDRGYRTSWVWACNVLEHISTQHWIEKQERRHARKISRREKLEAENITGIHKTQRKTCEIRSIIY